jgi:ABC-type uncharacterized transport system involved in gliding motility auxiliary subunit
LTNEAFFAAWCLGLLVLFALALRLPTRIRGPRWRGALWNALVAAAAIAVVLVANVAVLRHDLHLDLTPDEANTPPEQLQSVVAGLGRDIAVTYFFNSADPNALKARDLLAIAARENPRFRARAVDLDKEPAAARRMGIGAYNTAIVEAGERRTVVENTADVRQIAYAALRVLKQTTDVVCLVTGHGETAASGHVHFAHVETLKGHDSPGAGDVIAGEPDGIDRLLLALGSLGYTARPLALAAAGAVPQDCTAVAEIGPRRPYLPGEAAALRAYLASGGRLLLMIDPTTPLEPELSGLLAETGLSAEPAMVLDALNHYGPDPEKVAVPYFPPHPITQRVALSVFPEARPIRIERVPEGIAATVLAASSNDSTLRRLAPTAAARVAVSTADASAPARAPAVLAVALEGRWPEATENGSRPFRLVLVGNSNFATNAYFPYVSNGDLAVAMVRWLAGDEALTPVKPSSYSLARVDVTSRQMRDIFVAVELVLPLSVVLVGASVWWRRR